MFQRPHSKENGLSIHPGQYRVLGRRHNNNSSNGFLYGSGLFQSYYPGATSVMSAGNKWDKYRFLLKGPQQELVPFVLEVQAGGVTVPASSSNACFRIFLLWPKGSLVNSGLIGSPWPI